MFIGVTAFLMVLIAVVMFFPRVISVFETGDTSEDITDRSVMLVKADDAAQADIVLGSFAASFTDYDVQ